MSNWYHNLGEKLARECVQTIFQSLDSILHNIDLSCSEKESKKHVIKRKNK